jgi:hypothetical protein
LVCHWLAPSVAAREAGANTGSERRSSVVYIISNTLALPRGNPALASCIPLGLSSALPLQAYVSAVQTRLFLCPQFRAGLCDLNPPRRTAVQEQVFLCPWFRAGLLRPFAAPSGTVPDFCFYALGFGLGFATTTRSSIAIWGIRFYALGFGLGFAAVFFLQTLNNEGTGVSMPSVSGWAFRLQLRFPRNPNPPFLCPRFRAGLCDARHWYSRHHSQVSMPSVSGWALRRPTRSLAARPIG